MRVSRIPVVTRRRTAPVPPARRRAGPARLRRQVNFGRGKQRCRYHSAWASSSACAVSMAMSTTSAESSGWCSIRSARTMPSMYCMTMKTPVFFADFVDNADIGMVQCRGGSGLVDQPLPRRVALGATLGKHLDSDLAPEHGVFREKDFTHPADPSLRMIRQWLISFGSCQDTSRRGIRWSPSATTPGKSTQPGGRSPRTGRARFDLERRQDRALPRIHRYRCRRGRLG